MVEEDWKAKIITPRVSAAGIVESLDRKSILIIERIYQPFGFAIPGGMMNVGETIEECAIREVFEETNIVADSIGLLAVFSHPDNDPRWHVVINYLVMQAVKDMEPTGRDDAKDAFWLKIDENNMWSKLTKSSHEIIRRYMTWRENEYELLKLE